MGLGFLGLVWALARTLAATIVLECAFGWLAFGLRSAWELRVVALAQVVTNPAVELVALACGWSPHLAVTHPAWLVLGACEVAALVVEALLYRAAELNGRPWTTSAVLNAVSFGVGLAWALLGVQL